MMLINVEIWHAKLSVFPHTIRYGMGGFDDEKMVKSFGQGNWTLVAKLSFQARDVQEALAKAFDFSQNKEKEWNPNTRSTSVGDIVKVHNELWACAPFGWNKLPNE